MGINSILLNKIKDFLVDYGCYEDEIERFLTGGWGFLRRQKEAISILEGIITSHGKEELLGPIVELARVEIGIRLLKPRARDHVVHALLSFLLGIYINEYVMKSSGCGVGAFQWKLAGLFHDIGYPAAFANDILKPFSFQINTIKQNLGLEVPDVFFKVVPDGLDHLTSGVDSLQLIQQQLDNWGLAVNARLEYSEMLDSGEICHGIMSSLSVLYVVDLMYQKYNFSRRYQAIFDPNGSNWNQSIFETDVVPACSAIFVHNLPKRCFKDSKLNKQQAPLAFLLRLSDCLQDWDRPSAENPSGILNSKFKIDNRDGKLKFTVTDHVCRSKIAREIQDTLDTSDVDLL